MPQQSRRRLRRLNKEIIATETNDSLPPAARILKLIRLWEEKRTYAKSLLCPIRSTRFTR